MALLACHAMNMYMLLAYTYQVSDTLGLSASHYSPTMSCVYLYPSIGCLHEQIEYQGRLLLGSGEIMQTYLLGIHPEE